MTKVYIDMDGVLADFFGEIERMQNVSHYSKINVPETMAKIKGTPFFSTLPKLPNADLLVNTVVNLFGNYSILSTPLPEDEGNTIKHKHIWIETYLPIQPQQIVFSQEKHLYAKGNILIDDHRPNINLWQEHGGIGIKYKALSKNYTVYDIIEKLHGIKSNIL